MTHYDGYAIKNGRILITDDDGNAEDFCEEVRVVKVITDVVTKERVLGIKIVRLDGTTDYIEVPRADIAKDPISALSKVGLSVAPEHPYVITITEILFDTETTAKREYRHDCLGFRNTRKGVTFWADSVLGSTIQSTYVEPERLRPKGDFELWRAGIIEHTQNRPELQLALAIGASAPVAARLKELSLLDGAAVFALIGESSSGKTTALKMMASIWGRPSICDGVIDTFVSTEAYFFAELGKKQGFPHFVDEVSAQPNVDLTSMIYNISLGRERGRCKPDGTPRPRKKWSGTVIFTGENSMLQQSNGNRGLHARMVELACQWTADAETAEDMNRFIQDQHGTAFEPLVRAILDMGDEKMKDLFIDAYDEICEEFQPQNGVERRIVKLYVVIMISALVAANAWDIPFDFPAVKALLKVHHIGNEGVKDRTRNVFESIKQQILDNWSKFPTEDDSCTSPSIWGQQGKHGDWSCVWVSAERFQTFLENAGEFNMKTALGKLHAKGWLAKFGDRYKKQVKLGKIAADCYCVVLQHDPVFANKLKSRKLNSQIAKHLLEDEPEDDDGADMSAAPESDAHTEVSTEATL